MMVTMVVSQTVITCIELKQSLTETHSGGPPSTHPLAGLFILSVTALLSPSIAAAAECFPSHHETLG